MTDCIGKRGSKKTGKNPARLKRNPDQLFRWLKPSDLEEIVRIGKSINVDRREAADYLSQAVGMKWEDIQTILSPDVKIDRIKLAGYRGECIGMIRAFLLDVLIDTKRLQNKKARKK